MAPRATLKAVPAAPKLPSVPVRHVDRQPIAGLEYWPGNPKRGDVEAIKDSMRRNGWYGSVLVQSSTMRIIAGNHRTQAYSELGGTHVPADLVDVDDRTAKRIVLADNRTAELGIYDPDDLLSLLGEVAGDEDGLLGTGYSEQDFEELLRKYSFDGGDPDDPPEGEKSFELVVACEDEQHQQMLLVKLRKMKLDVKAIARKSKAR